MTDTSTDAATGAAATGANNADTTRKGKNSTPHVLQYSSLPSITSSVTSKILISSSLSLIPECMGNVQTMQHIWKEQHDDTKNKKRTPKSKSSSSTMSSKKTKRIFADDEALTEMEAWQHMSQLFKKDNIITSMAAPIISSSILPSSVLSSSTLTWSLPNVPSSSSSSSPRLPSVSLANVNEIHLKQLQQISSVGEPKKSDKAPHLPLRSSSASQQSKEAEVMIDGSICDTLLSYWVQHNNNVVRNGEIIVEPVMIIVNDQKLTSIHPYI
jgi:hypothetical protein